MGTPCRRAGDPPVSARVGTLRRNERPVCRWVKTRHAPRQHHPGGHRSAAAASALADEAANWQYNMGRKEETGTSSFGHRRGWLDEVAVEVRLAPGRPQVSR